MSPPSRVVWIRKSGWQSKPCSVCSGVAQSGQSARARTCAATVQSPSPRSRFEATLGPDRAVYVPGAQHLLGGITPRVYPALHTGAVISSEPPLALMQLQGTEASIRSSRDARQVAASARPCPCLRGAAKVYEAPSLHLQSRTSLQTARAVVVLFL